MSDTEKITKIKEALAKIKDDNRIESVLKVTQEIAKIVYT